MGTILQVSPTENTMILGVLGIAILGLLYALFLTRQILSEPKGTAKMQEVWTYIKTGANAYLRSQFRIIAVLIVVLVVVLFFSVAVVKPSPFAIQKFCPEAAQQAISGVDVNKVTADYRATHQAYLVLYDVKNYLRICHTFHLYHQIAKSHNMHIPKIKNPANYTFVEFYVCDTLIWN